MSVSKEYYKDLSVEELVQDEFFIRSIRTPDEGTGAFWKEFLQQYPQQKDVLEAAGSFVQSLKFKQKLPPEGTKERVWQAIQSGSNETPVVSMKQRRTWKWIAAAVTAAAVMATVFLWQPAEKNTMISSNYGEVKQLQLPDKSVVTLNANSTLEFHPDWSKNKPREVWLKGEGFFEVQHLHKSGDAVKDADRFIVHTGGVRIEVLGTSFNASDRHSVTRVVLEKGSVRIDIGDSSLLMQPGELVEYDQENKNISRRNANVEKALSWKRKELMLDHTTMKEVARIIEDNFGYKVIVEDNGILERQITGTGTISMDTEQTLFKALEVILQIEIRKEQNTLHIKNR